MSKKPVIAIAGATGLVGSEMINIIGEKNIPFEEVRLLASEDSVGEMYKVGSQEAVVEKLEAHSFDRVDVALFATGQELSKEFVPLAVKAGALAIDNSSYFRMQEDVPLVVPEVNGDLIQAGPGIIANPNCSTIQLVPVLQAIDKAAGIKRVVVTTFQSVSGAGKAALDELWDQTLAVCNQKEIKNEVFPHQIAFNCIPQIDLLMEDGFTKEEQKIMRESRKILGLPQMAIVATAVRVPVFHGHAESVTVETCNPLSPQQCVELLQTRPELQVRADAEDYPMQLQVVGNDEIYVGRIRRDPSVENGLAFWVVADNVRKGAALNAVQIMQKWLSLPMQH
jgi:aspartate-semialdehyde dehydrogenase